MFYYFRKGKNFLEKTILWELTISKTHILRLVISLIVMISIFKNDQQVGALIYRNILLIHPGRIYEQRTNLIGLYSGFGGWGGRWLICRKGSFNRDEIYFKLQSVKLITFLSFF